MTLIWLAGALRSLFDNTEIKDYDVYFKNLDDFKSFVEYIETMRHALVQDSSYDEMRTYQIKGIRLQIIGFRNSATVEDLLGTFDFTATRFGYDGKRIVFDRYAYQDAVAKKLNIYKIQNPLPMIKRALKYANKGYFVPNDTMDRLFGALIDKHPEVAVENDYEGLVVLSP